MERKSYVIALGLTVDLIKSFVFNWHIGVCVSLFYEEGKNFQDEINLISHMLFDSAS